MRVLFLTHRLPYAPNRGDRIRAHHMLRVLGRRHDVHLVSLVHDDEEQRGVACLKSIVASVEAIRVPRWRNLVRVPLALPSGVPLTHVLLDAPDMQAILSREVVRHRPDVVLAYCSGMARFALERPLDAFPLILDMLDVDSRKWSGLAARSHGLRRWVYQRETRHLARFEAYAAGRSQVTTVVNERERVSLLELAPSANVHVLPNGIDACHFRPNEPPADNARVVFTGVFDYRPNEEGAIWMVEQVWPRVRASRPDARLLLVGANPTRAVRRLQRDASIEVTGTVPDVRPYLWGAAVAVVPLAVARGLQNKALEAVAAGLPVVVTRIVHEGLPSNVGPSCVVADDPHEFAAAVCSLLARSPAERRSVAERADLSSLDWPAQLSPLLEMVEATSRQPRARIA